MATLPKHGTITFAAPNGKPLTVDCAHFLLIGSNSPDGEPFFARISTGPFPPDSEMAQACTLFNLTPSLLLTAILCMTVLKDLTKKTDGSPLLPDQRTQYLGHFIQYLSLCALDDDDF